MKKFIVFVMAAVAVMNFSSCNNEMDMLDPIAKSKEVGYINIDATTEDVVVVTRAEPTPVSNISTWYAKVYRTVDNNTVYGWSDNTNNNDYKQIGSKFSTTPFAAATWTVDVRNHKSLDDALAANSGFGDAYYEGPITSVSVTAGNTARPSIACGAPKNTKLTIDGTGFGGTALSVTTTSPRSLTFNEWKTTDKHFTTEDAYFTAQATVTYRINYTINGITKETTAVSFDMGNAGTSKKLTITSNTNGTITLTLTTEGFSDPDNVPVTIDAATGVIL